MNTRMENSTNPDQKEGSLIKAISNLIGNVFEFLAYVIIGWAIPLISVAIAAPVFSIIITINPIIGGTIVFIVIALIGLRCIFEGMWWQLFLWLLLLLPLALLSFASPVWALYWSLFIESLTLGILFVFPGIVWSSFRELVKVWLFIGIILTSTLIGVLFTNGIVYLVLLGFIILGGAMMLFSKAARPWEIRRAQRRVGKILSTLGIVILLSGIFLPIIKKIHFSEIDIPKPIKNIGNTITLQTEKWVIQTQRSLVGEQIKTNTLQELTPEIQQNHRKRWKNLINRIPEAPPSSQEWEELGVPQDP